MFSQANKFLNRANDPVYSCELYKDNDAGSCVHVDGLLCDSPKCSMLTDYRNEELILDNLKF